ncbi:MAG: twin-arginine translocase TatA/TatE family subunit [Halobacteriales archaeon]|nr:twin-arginine translocase TatA/TatE family subunit [Halobacteriales archaeon]
MVDVIAPLFVGGLGPLEIGIILLLLVLLFGADKIPKLARSAGDAKKEFEKAKMEAEKEVKEYEKELEEDVEEVKPDVEPEPQPSNVDTEEKGDSTTTASTDG